MSALLSDMIGFGLVVFASAGICAALNVQKYVHIKNTDPSTGQPMVSFMEIPLWWVGTIGNLVAEIMNLAALGYAPATLVTPLGCLTVVFNAVAAHLLLGEPFLRQDAIGITFIIVGVVCVVFSQVGEPQPPITPTCVQTPPGQTCTGLSEVVVSGGFWILIAIVVVGLFLMYRYVHERYCQKYAWVYLVESSLVSSLTIVSARCFASFLGFPMPGKWSYFWISPDWVYAWGSLVCLIVTAVGGLLLQNAALMYFKASEVVPLYFCLFSLGGVAASGLAFDELTMPWILLLAPGVGCCIAGVFVISYKRDEYIMDRLTMAIGADGPRDFGMPPTQDSMRDSMRDTPSERRTTGCGQEPSTRALSTSHSGLNRSTTACDGGGDGLVRARLPNPLIASDCI